jgi:hypothetical protein
MMGTQPFSKTDNRKIGRIIRRLHVGYSLKPDIR